MATQVEVVDQFTPSVCSFDQMLSSNEYQGRNVPSREVFTTYEAAHERGVEMATAMVALGSRSVEVTVQKRTLVRPAEGF